MRSEKMYLPFLGFESYGMEGNLPVERVARLVRAKQEWGITSSCSVVSVSCGLDIKLEQP